MRITRKRMLMGLAVLAGAGVGLAWSGFVNVGASTGHAAITDWFLHWAMRNSVRTHAASSVGTPATDPTGLVSAAGHYASHCAVCHGSPAERASPVMQSQTPPPPDLSETAPTWSDRELFWIIRHGVKFTAMPAWPALEREDEIRRMAAFVRRLPAMTADEYRRLAYGPSTGGLGTTTRFDRVLEDCERCHAEDGRAQADIPVLVGQKQGYLEHALERFATGARESGVMQAAAARLDGALIVELAAHYARLPGLSEGDTRADIVAMLDRRVGTDDASARIVAFGLPAVDLPACTNCHAPDKRPQYPRLRGQKAEYLEARLRHWRSAPGTTEAEKSNDTMPVIARRIPEEMVWPLARYLAGHEPSSGSVRVEAP